MHSKKKKSLFNELYQFPNNLGQYNKNEMKVDLNK